jgi:hypothetical protein
MQVVMPQRSPVRVSSTDWLKLVGIAAFLIDHTGLFFIEDDEWWRILGRIAAPIFFFLIGFARSRNIPLSWMVWGVILTGIDWWMDGDFTLNILLNFAFIRLALRLLDKAEHKSLLWFLGAAALFSILMMPFADFVFEYGAQGWLWALFGYAQRAWRDGYAAFEKMRFALAFIAGLTYAFVEIEWHDFEGLEAVGCALVVLGLTLALVRFDRSVSTLQPPRALAPFVVWLSRYSLEIYAISLFLMQDIFYVFQ